nr:hypothetical protein GCM10020093_001600 [Planobispora longispora]
MLSEGRRGVERGRARAAALSGSSLAGPWYTEVRASPNWTARRSSPRTGSRPDRRARPCRSSGAGNAKRRQDVEEILDVGVDVVSTVNIQHSESLNDAVRQIIGAARHETVPDEVVRRAARSG